MEFGMAASLRPKFERRSRAQDARKPGGNSRAGVSRADRILRREDRGRFAGTAGVRTVRAILFSGRAYARNRPAKKSRPEKRLPRPAIHQPFLPADDSARQDRPASARVQSLQLWSAPVRR